jgi:spermidine/putrescine transport system permease protein
LEKSGVINQILGWLGLPAQNMINTEGAIVLGMVYNYLPFMVLPIYNALAKISQDTFDAARDLGAGWWQIMRRITLPMIFPGIVSGSTMVIVPALTTFVLSDMLGGAKILLIGNVIEQEFTTANNWNMGAGLSLVLMAIVIVSMAFMSRYDKSGEGAGIW